MRFLLLLLASFLYAQDTELLVVEPVNSRPGRIVFQSTGADALPVTTNDIMLYNKNKILFCKDANSLDCFNIVAPTVAYASLGSPTNGTLYYCPTCQQTNPCASGGTGAVARRENSVWNCGGGGGGAGGITSLGGQTGATQTFSNVNDTNVTLAIASATNNHAFTLGWTGTLAKARQHANTVYNDASNTFSTGTQDFSAATALTVPVSAGAAPTTNGRIAYDSTANAFKVGVSSASVRLLTGTDGTQQAAVVLPELTANGTSVFIFSGAPAQSADVCIEVNGSQPAGSGYYLITTSNSNSRTIDGSSKTCREAQWTQITDANELTFPAANCQNTTASTGFDLPTANYPAAACVTGSNTQYGVLQFDAATDESVQTAFDLPATWTGAIDVVFKWRAAATTGNVVWAIQTACVAVNETGDPAFNTASTVTDATAGTTLQFNTASITGITTTGCAVSERLFLKLYRDADSGSDTMSGDADLISAILTVRKTL